VANTFAGTVSVLLGDGHGGFGAPMSFTTGAGPFSVAVGDFNGDGAPDLAVAAAGNSDVDVLLNQARVTTTTLTSTTNPAVAGQEVSLNAAVTQAVPGPFGPTGLVTFYDGATPLGSGTLDGTGHARLTTTTLATGSGALTAVYQGDPHFNSSTSPVLDQLVNQDTTTTTLTTNANPAMAGQALMLTATVGPAATSAGSPTGTVIFMDGSATLGTGTLSAGVASHSTTLAAGSHSLSAVYLGDNNFTGSTAAAVAETLNNPVPVVTGLAPTAVPEGSPAFTLTINGVSLLVGATVTWNGTPLTITAAGGTQIQAAVPAALLTDETTASVVVTNPGGAAWLPQTFTVGDAPLNAHAQNLNVIGNKSFSGVLATFIDANLSAGAADFQAIIVWDDGTAQFGTVTGSSGSFTVSGSHTFAKFTTLHTVTVTIFDRGGNTVTVTDDVIDPPGPQPGGGPGAAGHGIRHHHHHHAGHGTAHAGRHPHEARLAGQDEQGGP
jgi:hypothetical protein